METQTWYVVQNEQQEYLALSIERCVGEYYSEWGTLVDATYFEDKKTALKEALPYEKAGKVMFIQAIEVRPEKKERANVLAEQLEQKQKNYILTAIQEGSTIGRHDVEEVFDIVMEGEGKIIAKKKSEEQHLYFEEVTEDGWVLKKEGIVFE